MSRLARVVAAGLLLGLGLVPDAAASTAQCRPWQTPTPVPSGGFTPRVFPSDEVTPTAVATTRSTTTRPVACRNAPPKPFAHPSWEAGSVVGGERLAATGLLLDAPAGVPAPPAVYDVSYVIADVDSGEILAAKSPHAWLRPASTLKTLTALTLMPLLDPKRVVVASPEAVRAEGTRVGILEGNRYPVSSLLDAMVIFSANDAVYVLADAAGGYDKTVALMNAKAAELGAYDTVTVDPSGLDEGRQRSSAYDLALIGRAALQLPAFRAAAVKRDIVFPGGTDANGRKWKPFHVANINELLAHYPGTIGVKPGRTDRAQHTFIGAATRGGRTLIVSQMGSVTGAWEPTAALLDWAFANADKVTPVGHLVAPGEASPPRPAAATTTATTPGTPTTAADGSSPPATGGGGGAAAAPPTGDELMDESTAVTVVTGALAGVLTGAVALVGVILVRRRRAGR